MKTRMVFVKRLGRTKALFSYFMAQCHLAKNLQNTANFYIRNLRTGLFKEPDKRTANEAEVIRITEASIKRYNENQHLLFRKKAASFRKSLVKGNVSAMAAASQVIQKLSKLKVMSCPDKEHWMVSYDQLNAILYWSGNHDYFAMPAQANQQILRRVIKSWAGYFTSLTKYKEHPETFTGSPNMPGYNGLRILPFITQTRSSNLLRQAERIIFPSLAGVWLCALEKMRTAWTWSKWR